METLNRIVRCFYIPFLKGFLIGFVVTTLILSAKAGELNEETEFKFGIGTLNSAKDSNAEVKTVSLGYSENFAFGLRKKYQFQGWLDSRSDIGRKPGGYFSALLGVDVNPGDIYASFYMGVGLKLPNDSYLGGPLQFNEQLEVGIRDKQNKSIGICISHISSAGIHKPNVGRDFIQLKVGVPF